MQPFACICLCAVIARGLTSDYLLSLDSKPLYVAASRLLFSLDTFLRCQKSALAFRLINIFQLKTLNRSHFFNISVCFVMQQCQSKLLSSTWELSMPARIFKQFIFPVSVCQLSAVYRAGGMVYPPQAIVSKKKINAMLYSELGNQQSVHVMEKQSARYKKCRLVLITFRPLNPRARQLAQQFINTK